MKLLDFGIAKYASSEAQTQHHDVKGKPAYLAPEVIEGGAFDARVDLFSLGVVLHELLTLAPLFAADSDLGILHKVLEMPIAAPSRARPDVPRALDAIVMKALERDPARRYASAAEMARDLDQFVVASHLHNDEVIAFLRGVQPLLNQPPGAAAAAALAASVGSCRRRRGSHQARSGPPAAHVAHRPPPVRTPGRQVAAGLTSTSETVVRPFSCRGHRETNRVPASREELTSMVPPWRRITSRTM